MLPVQLWNFIFPLLALGLALAEHLLYVWGTQSVLKIFLPDPLLEKDFSFKFLGYWYQGGGGYNLLLYFRRPHL